MSKIQIGLEEVMTKEDIVIGDVSGADFNDDLDIPGLAIMQDVEAALPRCIAMIKIFAAEAAKEGPLADAAALKKAIDAAPGDLDIPVDILGNVARRAATEIGLDVQELTAILDVSATASSEYAVGRLPIGEAEKVNLADSIMMTVWCNFARDPSTPMTLMANVVDSLLSVVHLDSELVSGLNDMKILFDQSYTAPDGGDDASKVPGILKNIKNASHKFQKPFQVNWPVLKACRQAATDFVLALEMSETHKSKIASLCAIVEDLEAAKKRSNTNPNTQRLMTIRSGLTSIRESASPAVLDQSASQVTTIEEFLQGQFNIELEFHGAQWMAAIKPIFLEIFAKLDDTDNTSAMLVALWDRWSKLFATIKIIGDKAIKSYASPESALAWTKRAKCRERVCELLPKILTVVFADKDNKLLLSEKLPNDMVNALVEFKTILSRCESDVYKLCYFPDAEFADKFHAIFCKFLPIGTGACFYIGFIGVWLGFDSGYSYAYL